MSCGPDSEVEPASRCMLAVDSKVKDNNLVKVKIVKGNNTQLRKPRWSARFPLSVCKAAYEEARVRIFQQGSTVSISQQLYRHVCSEPGRVIRREV